MELDEVPFSLFRRCTAAAGEATADFTRMSDAELQQKRENASTNQARNSSMGGRRQEVALLAGANKEKSDKFFQWATANNKADVLEKFW